MENDSELTIYQLHAEICKTLSNPTRLRILSFLRNGEKSVSELVKLTGVRQSNVSQHLAVLRQRGIVVVKKEGATVLYRIANPKIIQACDIIRDVLFEQFAKSRELIRKYSRKGR
jgi:ArsR family transcriptional regulator